MVINEERCWSIWNNIESNVNDFVRTPAVHDVSWHPILKKKEFSHYWSVKGTSTITRSFDIYVSKIFMKNPFAFRLTPDREDVVF